jgi:hypothetical protein
MRKHASSDDNDRFIRVSNEAERESGVPAKHIYAAEREGNITIYKINGGRLNYVKVQCLKRLAKDLFQPRSKKRPATTHPGRKPPGRGDN